MIIHSSSYIYALSITTVHHNLQLLCSYVHMALCKKRSQSDMQKSTHVRLQTFAMSLQKPYILMYLFLYSFILHTALAPNEVEVQGKTKSNVAPRSRHSAVIPNGMEEEYDKNVYLDLLTPSAEDLKRAQAHSDSRLLKILAAATQRILMARK